MSDLHLIPNITAEDIAKEPMKKGYSVGLVAAGKKYDQIVAASADVSGSTGSDAFAQEFPDRFIEVGVAEQNLVTMASGLAKMGKNPFVSAYAAFSPGRNWEQIRTTIALNDMPVKVISTHVGVSDSPDGATHQMLEDLALMRSIPNMTVISPCDSVETAKVIMELGAYDKPAYVRIARDDTEIITTEKTPFKIGKAYVYREGTDVTIVATGRMTYRALVASEKLAKDGISAEVIHCPTIKPLDDSTILKSVRKTGAVVTAEEAQMYGGLGGTIAELLSLHLPTPLSMVAAKDRFGESGSQQDLFKALGLTENHIVMAAHDVLSKREG